jgi:serine/threonine protein phosphatase PrpC
VTNSKIECYAASLPQQGRSSNEDAFLVLRESPPFAALCDGAGNAQQAAKRVLALLEKFFRETPSDELSNQQVWSRWVKLLDSSIMGSAQSTLIALTVVGGQVIGTCVGDSRVYLVDREGGCRILTEGASKFRLGSGKAESFFVRLPLTTGDTLLVLSDGAWTPLNPYVLRKEVQAALPRGFAEVPSAILAAAGRAGRADDMTAICLRIAK